LEQEGNRVELQIHRCEILASDRVRKDYSAGQDEKAKLKQKAIGKKGKQAGFRDYIKYYTALLSFPHRFLICRTGEELTTDKLLPFRQVGSLRDPVESPYVKFTFLFRSSCMSS
jgi:hypothetical protein